QDVYPGINLVYYGNQDQLEYDFVVAPGADPAAVALSFTGAGQAEIDSQGDLVLQTAAGPVIQHKPLLYQEVNGTRQEVAGNFVLAPTTHEVGFAVGAYDRSRPLVIDPKVRYTYTLGGLQNDEGFSIALTQDGKATVTGFTESIDFPVQNPWQGQLA